MSPTKRVGLALVAVSVLSLLVGFFASTIVKSPAQVAAETAPPPATALTAKVENGAVQQDVITSGVVSLGNKIALSPPGPDGLDPVITREPLVPGSPVGPTTVLLEVSDRPIILLPGDVPLLRDLSRGNTGPDVTRLQNALRNSGFAVSDRAGLFGPATSHAVGSLYSVAGYAAPLDGSGRPVARRSELVFAPNGAVGSVVAIGAGLGQPVVQPVVTVTTSPEVVTASLNESDAAQLSVGQSVSLTGTFLDKTINGKISVIGVLAQSPTGGFQVPVQIVPETNLPTASLTMQVGLAIHTSADAVSGLIVPLAALHSAADGDTSVIVVAGKHQARVPVHVAQTANGVARITVAGNRLVAGDSVLIGSSP